MKRGEVYWAELKPRSHSEQSGRRPVLVISHNGFNDVDSWRSVIVIPFSTSFKQAVRGPTVVIVPRGVADLPSESVALSHQITTLDRSKLKEHIGMLPKSYLKKIEQAIRAAVDLE